jgi:hypothetical protein
MLINLFVLLFTGFFVSQRCELPQYTVLDVNLALLTSTAENCFTVCSKNGVC